MLEGLLLLALIGGLLWYWDDSLKVRESVLLTCRRLAEQMDVQFLDQSVYTEKARLKRDPDDGHIKIQRFFRFEFSSDGLERQSGQAITLGHRLQHLDMDLPQGRVIEMRPKPPDAP